MPERLRWGILGTGNIARQFSAGVNASKRGRLTAVASRSADSAAAFAKAHSVPRSYGSYARLLTDDDVDAVYVSLPNSLHHEWTVLALQAGKHVLCEKPLASNAAESEQMFDEAERAGRLLMEAFMYRCHGQTLAVLEAVRRGAIGQLKLIRTSFCYRTTRIAENIRFRPELAGGALMDVGCYCLSFSRLIAGAEPIEATAAGHLHASGVDDLVAGLLRFPGANGDRANPVLATFTCGMGVQADNTAYICGSEGYIEIPVPWKPPVSGATYTIAHSTPPKMDLAALQKPGTPIAPPRQTFTVDGGMDVFGVEADDFAASVLDGRPPRVSRQDTIGNMQLLDQLRRKIAQPE
jgi:xylose dehydrogenase (NAD/NADP)